VLPAVHRVQLQEGPAGADLPRNPKVEPGQCGAAAVQAWGAGPGEDLGVAGERLLELVVGETVQSGVCMVLSGVCSCWCVCYGGVLLCADDHHSSS
jgi:hypothetical protein